MRRSTLRGVGVPTAAVLAAAAFTAAAVWVARPAGAADPPPTTRPAPATAAAAADRDVISAGDLLIVYYPDVTPPGTEYARPSRVGSAGAISVPLAGDLKVAGLTLREAEQAIGASLQKAKIVDRASVSIDRQERAAAASVPPGPIAPGDVLRVAVWELLGPGVEQVRRLHVSGDGAVGLPILGQTKLAGLTESEAEAAIVKAYRDARLVERAIVSVLRVKPAAGPEPIPSSIVPGRPPK